MARGYYTNPTRSSKDDLLTLDRCRNKIDFLISIVLSMKKSRRDVLLSNRKQSFERKQILMNPQPENTNEKPTVNPGDRIVEGQSLEEKSEQVAVDSWDITGHVTVPTYFVVENPDGSEEALHHVKDAEEISDVIRQARVDENGDRVWD